MANKETDIVHLCMMQASKCGAVMMKNIRGMFLTLDGSRKVQAGLSIKGSSDLVGWKSTIITEKMVGSRIAVFVAAEAKTALGKASLEQQVFIDNVRKAGGIAGVVRSEKDMQILLDSLHDVQ